MDYRSIIALSYENKQNALKEVKKKSTNSASASSKQKGPSNDAVKRFLEKKKNDELEWYKKIKVDKPPPPPKKSKEKIVKTKEIISEGKKSETQTHLQEKTKKSSDGNQGRSAPKRLSSVSDDKESIGRKKLVAKEEISKKNITSSSKSEKSSVNSVHNKKSKESPKVSPVPNNEKELKYKKSDSKSSFVPSFSNYNKILEMANRNAQKPPKFVANPDYVKTDEGKQKRKSEKFDPLFESQLEVSAPKKRKLTNDGNGKMKRKSDSEASIKNRSSEENSADMRKQSVVSNNVDKVYTKSPKSVLNVTNKVQSSSTASKQKSSEKPASQAPSVPVKRGIAAQLSNNVSFSCRDDFRANSMSPAGTSKPNKPSHINDISDKQSSRHSSANDSHHSTKHNSQYSKQKPVPESARNSTSNTVPKKGVATETKISSKSKVKNSSKASEPVKKSVVSNGMSVTMEDDDTDFMHISRKKDSKAPPLAAPEPPRRGIAAQSAMEPPRRGIAAQSRMSCGPPIRRGIAAQNSAFESSYMKSRPYRPCIDTDEEEDDYDEDDDFIDDSELVTDTQYKSYVQEIHQTLRFDPSKYETIKPWDDLKSMESNYKEIQKEEKRSARLGMKEDLADIKAEEERMKKKKKKKR